MTGAPDRHAQVALDELDWDALDPEGMLGIVEDSAAQWDHALALGRRAFERIAADQTPGNVVIAGMGGSGIAGDIAVAVASAEGSVPVVAVKGCRLPAFVGSDTLVVAVSHSGNTEETLACVDQAVAAGARIVAVTSGGELARRAETEGFALVTVPGDHQPRASLAYLVVPVLVALDRVGVVGDGAAALESVPGHLRDLVRLWGRDVPEADNEAKQLAVALRDRVPLFYGGAGVPAVVALRAKCQVNENAAMPAFHNMVPELGHNELVGWDHAGELSQRTALVCLRSPDEDPRIAARFAATKALTDGVFAASVEHQLRGDTPMQRLTGGILLVDLASVYLALLAGTDPTPVAILVELKQRVAAAAGEPS